MWTSVARAENYVVIVVPSGDNIDYSTFENRLRFELIAAGYATITATLPAPIDAATLPAIAARFSTNVAVSLSILDGIVYGFVSITDPIAHKNTIRAVPGYPIGEQTPGVFAVRATDVLHGAMLELNYVRSAPQIQRGGEPAKSQRLVTPAPKQAEVTGRAPARASPLKAVPASKSANQRERWGVYLGGTLNGGVRSMPMAPGGEIGFYRQERYWGASAEASVYVPVSAAFSDTRITVGQWMIGGALQLYQPIGRVVTVFESVGSGIYDLQISASSPRQENDRKPSYAVGYSSTGAGLISNLNDRTALALRLRMVVPWRTADFIVKDEVAARLAFPIVLVDFGLRIAF